MGPGTGTDRRPVAHPAEFGGVEVVGSGVGPVLEKFRDVARIAVLRGGGLGDLLFALPAVAALKAAYPGATVTVLGTPIHAALAEGIAGPVDSVCVLPLRRRSPSRPGGPGRDGQLLRRDEAGGVRPGAPAARRRTVLESVPPPVGRPPHGGNTDAGRRSVGTHAALRLLPARAAAGPGSGRARGGTPGRAGGTAAAPGPVQRRGPMRCSGTGPGRPDPLAPRPASWWSIPGQRIRAGAGRPPVSPRWPRPARQMAARCSWWATPASANLQRTWCRPRARTTSGPSPAKPTSAPWPRCWTRCDVMVANDSGPRHLAQALGTPLWGFTGQGTSSMPGPWAAACTGCTSPG